MRVISSIPKTALSRKKSLPQLPRGIGIGQIKNGAGKIYWRVRLGKRFTGAKVINKDFQSLEDAHEWVNGEASGKAPKNGIVGLKNQIGQTAFDLSPQQLTEAITAYKRLTEVKANITEAADYYLRHAKPEGGCKTIPGIEKEFLASRRAINCKPKTVVMYASFLRRIAAEFGETPLHEITRQEVEDWLAESEWSPRTRKNYVVTLTTLFNYGMSVGYCVSNPAANIPRPILEDRPPGILTPVQVGALLKQAAKDLPDMVAPIAIGLFAGLRRSELCALNWSEIDMEGRTIEITARKAKTRQRRIVGMDEILVQWLTAYRKKEGMVAPCFDTFGGRLQRLSRAAGITEWPHNALRHSFGSYFYARTKNENLTAAEMGNSPSMVFRHYRALVRAAEVEAYWSLKPTAVAS